MPARKLATYDDLLAHPEGEHVELHGGHVVTQPGGLPFDDDTEGPTGWWILPEVDIRFTTHDVTYDDTALARIPPFDAIELPVGRLFFPRPQP